MSNQIDYDHTSIIKYEDIYEELMKKSAVKLCKAIRDDRLLKRNLDKDLELLDFMYKTALSLTPDLSVDDIVNYIKSSDETLQLLAIQTYRKLSREKHSSINDMTEGDIVSRFIKLLDSNNTTLQSEVIALLTTLTTGTAEQSQNIIKYETISKLMELFKSTSSIVAEQAVCALGNIVENRPYVRDFLLKCDALRLLVDLIKPDTSITFMDNISWLLSNLCQRNPPLSLELIRPVLPVLDCLFNIENEYITSDTCRILSYLTDGYKNNVRAVMETGVLSKVLECLISRKESIFIPALRTIRNIVETGDDAQKNAVIFAGGLSRFRTVLLHYGDLKDVIANEAIWAIYKMADNTDQIESVINADLLPVLINGIQYLRREEVIMEYQQLVHSLTLYTGYIHKYLSTTFSSIILLKDTFETSKLK